MKFDKFMEHSFRILCVSLACCLLVASIGACFAPVKARADEIELLYQLPERLQQYYYTGARQLDEVVDAVSTDLSNGDLQASTELAKHVGACYYLQNCLFSGYNSQIGSPGWCLGQATYKIYDAYYHEFGTDFYNNMPDSVSISSEGYSGFYYGDGVLYPVNIYYPITDDIAFRSRSLTLATSPEFTLTVDLTSNTENGYILYNSYYQWFTSYQGSMTLNTSGSKYIDSFTSNSYNRFNCYLFLSDRIPSFSSFSKNSLNSVVEKGNAGKAFGGAGSSASLPSGGSLDKEEPWLYYNNTLLPYMRATYPDVPDKYFVFPTGYTPPVTPNYFDPNVNFNGVGIGGLGGIIAGAGAIINIGGVGSVNVFAPIQGQINIDGIQFQIPLDGDSIFINKLPYSAPSSSIELGDHIIDLISKTEFFVDGIQYLLNSDGTISIDNVVYNLPIGTPAQLPTDSNEFLYEYEIPTVERINIVDADLQAPTLSTFGNAINFIWASVYTVLSSTGLLPLVAISLGLGAVGYVLWKIGG